MNYWLAAAAVVSVVTFGIHVFAGGPALHTRLLNSDMNPVAKSVWSVVWHAVSALIALNAIAYFVAARSSAQSIAISAYPLAISFCVMILFLIYGISRHRSIIVLPQWTLFFASSLLAMVGLLNV